MKYRGLLASLVVTLAITAGGCPEVLDGIKRGVATCGGEAWGDVQQAIHLGQAPDGGDYIAFIMGVVKEAACVEPIVVDEIQKHRAEQQACAIAAATVDGGAAPPASCAQKQSTPGEEQRARTVIAIARMAQSVTFDGGVK